jgi:type II secretory pathway component PulJ
MKHSLYSHRGGFTLLEALVGLAAAATLMASIVASSVTLQRSFYWSTDYSDQSLAQLRALDFITRDVRGATSVSLFSSGEVITMELPDAFSSYDAQGNPTSAPVTPVIVRGQPQYGDPTQPIVVTYYLVGTSLRRHQMVPATAQVSELVIATRISSFRAQFVGGGNLVRSTVTFMPRLRNDPASEVNTAMSATVAARPMTLKYDDLGGGGVP